MKTSVQDYPRVAEDSGLSSADTCVDHCWVEEGKLHAMVSLAGGELFHFEYEPEFGVSRFDNDAIGGFNPADVVCEVMGQLAMFYDLATLEELEA